jgi:hypothetical protein
VADEGAGDAREREADDVETVGARKVRRVPDAGALRGQVWVAREERLARSRARPRECPGVAPGGGGLDRRLDAARPSLGPGEKPGGLRRDARSSRLGGVEERDRGVEPSGARVVEGAALDGSGPREAVLQESSEREGVNGRPGLGSQRERPHLEGKRVVDKEGVDAVRVRFERRAFVFSQKVPVASRKGRIAVKAGLAIQSDRGGAEDLGQTSFRRAPAQLHLEQTVGGVDESQRAPRVDLEHGAHVRNALAVEARVDLRQEVGDDDPAATRGKGSHQKRGRRDRRREEKC